MKCTGCTVEPFLIKRVDDKNIFDRILDCPFLGT